ncbi:MAG: DoxX family protein [Bacteroidales bacterium]|nr:DoxX family protein [Bacteroidales bacterium]
MRFLLLICRIAAGLVFIFSGTVKAMDPLGSAYKFQDYFLAFNMDFLLPLSLPLGILLCTAEFFAGFSVLFNIRQKAGIWLLMLMMIVFTPLTFVLALTNPVTDCGCFGDVIHLTNWQTFIKNIVLLIPVTILFVYRNKVVPANGMIREWMTVAGILILFVAFSLFNLRNLPLIDFLPYKTGTHIPDKMIIPEGKPADRYETTFIYEKDGVAKEFSLENYPADDNSWTFVDQKTVLVEKGYEPPIHDFVLTTQDNADITESILTSEDFTFLMICQKIENIKDERLNKGFSLGDRLSAENIQFLVLTASGSGEISKYGRNHNVCSVDEITLKTMVRSDPGYMLLRGGTILGKWSWAKIPSFEYLSKEFFDN